MILFLVLVASIILFVGVSILFAVGGGLGWILLFMEPIVCVGIICLIIKAFRKKGKKKDKD